MSTFNSKTYPDPESYFTIGPYITDPQKFYGRDEELRTILHRLRTMQSTSVVGERRIGKSSLLYHIFQTGNARLQTNDLRFVFIDLQEAKFQRQDLFLKNVLKDLDLPHTRIQPDADITEALVAFSEEIEKLERKPVLLVDEFDDGLKHGRYSENFFEHLRSIIGSRKLGFVAASKKSLKDACLEGGYASPFYNVFTTKKLGPLTDEEAAQFLLAVHQDFGLTEFEWKLVNSYCTNEPIKLQIALKQILSLREAQEDKEMLFRARYPEELSSFFADTEDQLKALAKRGIKNWHKIANLILATAKAVK